MFSRILGAEAPFTNASKRERRSPTELYVSHSGNGSLHFVREATFKQVRHFCIKTLDLENII